MLHSMSCSFLRGTFSIRVRILAISTSDISIMENVEEKYCSAKEAGEMANEPMQREHSIHPLAGRASKALAGDPFSSLAKALLIC